jgi:hypothetical protein
MKTAIIVLPGLNTDPASDCWGLRPFVENLLAAELDGTGSQAFYFAWDKVRADTVAAAVAGFERIIAIGHSFGGAAVKWLADQFAAGAVKTTIGEGTAATSVMLTVTIDLAVFLDPAPNGDRFHQFCSWQMADISDDFRWHCPPSIHAAICFYQRNEQIIPGIIGVCGVPFHSRLNVTNVNVTKWGLYHCHMCGDSRVQAMIAAAIEELANAAQSQPLRVATSPSFDPSMER